MSTRSRIAIERQDGTVKSIYCHFDGDLQHVGKTLFNDYSDREKLEKLIELGNISSLGSKIRPETDEKHSFDNPAENVTVAYHRDRGDALKIGTYPNVEDFFENGFTGVLYLYCLTKENIWLTCRHGSNNVSILKEELEEEGI